MYHCVYNARPEESGFQNSTASIYKLSSIQFEAQVKAISNYLEMHSLPKSTVEFTFDDGGVSFFTVIKPILDKYNFKGVFFVTTKYIGRHGFMTSDQIKCLAKAGHVVGSHSHSHPERMDVLSKSELDEEWKMSRDILSKILNSNIETASIPNGYSSCAVIESMRKFGYKKIYTSKPSTKILEKNNVSIIGRYAITCNMSTDFVLKIVSSPKIRLKIKIRNTILNIAKTLLGNLYLTIRKEILKKK